MSNLIIVKCPTCQTDVVFAHISPFRPFCSKRCQLIDLGEWADEKKSIPGSPVLDEGEFWEKDLDNQ
ncbi:DNA gyrase inhibitor YacG [Thorsellia kenyensis]|uniref:DNA gyrase inhibitor YacG n=1 Tax=Thorsellia kenyensis TaxID=1549888 RepID=A0ABV6CCG0_9GAMM